MSLEPPPEPVFFLDRAVAARRVVEVLREHRISFHIHDDLFPQNTPDTTWLAEVGRKGWLVVTQDQRIRYNPLEKQALLASGVGAFIVVAKNLTGAQLADCLVRAVPKMQNFAQATPRPFIAKVYADGRIQLLTLS